MVASSTPDMGDVPDTGGAAGDLRGLALLSAEPLVYTHFFCYVCCVVVPITVEAAAEVAKHVGHRCRYTRIAG